MQVPVKKRLPCYVWNNLKRNLCFAGWRKLYTMNSKHFDYYAKHESRSFSDQQQVITYSFNDNEKTIIGAMEEKGDLIFLYEYRGKYIGTEFFISFSKNSISYKLIKIGEATKEVI